MSASALVRHQQLRHLHLIVKLRLIDLLRPAPDHSSLTRAALNAVAHALSSVLMRSRERPPALVGGWGGRCGKGDVRAGVGGRVVRWVRARGGGGCGCGCVRACVRACVRVWGGGAISYTILGHCPMQLGEGAGGAHNRCDISSRRRMAACITETSCSLCSIALALALAFLIDTSSDSGVGAGRGAVSPARKEAPA